MEIGRDYVVTVTNPAGSHFRINNSNQFINRRVRYDGRENNGVRAHLFYDYELQRAIGVNPRLIIDYQAVAQPASGGKRQAKKTRKHTRKIKRSSKKTRRASRKHHGGAMEYIFASSLNGVRDEVKKPYVRLVGLFQLVEAKNKKFGNYKEEQIDSVPKAEFEKLVTNHEITNEKLRKEWTYNKQASQKDKYFFMYV